MDDTLANKLVPPKDSDSGVEVATYDYVTDKSIREPFLESPNAVAMIGNGCLASGFYIFATLPVAILLMDKPLKAAIVSGGGAALLIAINYVGHRAIHWYKGQDEPESVSTIENNNLLPYQ